MAADRQLFEDGLRLLYGAHQQGAAQAARNGETSTLPKLKRMVRAGSKQNLAQAERLERVFALVGATPYARHDAGMQGICDTNEAEVAQHHGAAERDLVNIAYGQVAAHFYIAKYDTLRRAARALGHARRRSSSTARSSRPARSTAPSQGLTSTFWRAAPRRHTRARARSPPRRPCIRP